MGGNHSRRKGHQFERDVAIALRDVFPNARRHLEYQDSEADGVDLAETGHYRIQCKKREKYVSVTTIEEVGHDPIFECPVVVTAADNKPAMAILPFSELLVLLRETRRKKS